MYNEFIEYTKKQFPELESAFKKEVLSPNLFSFQTVKIENEVFNKIKNFVYTIYKLRNNTEYQTDILGHPVKHLNKSVLMSFDFHITDNSPKLIEINTNASHYLTSYLMERFICEKDNRKSSFPNALGLLENSFRTEWSLFSNRILKSICITDENPEEQKAYFEFLLYEALFKKMGLSVSIEDYRNLKYSSGKLLDSQETEIDFLYNRTTDFYFDQPESSPLKNAYDKKSACISPQPQEYQLLADKKRLLDFSTLGFLEKYLSSTDAALIKELSLDIFEATKEHEATIWENRKKYFFKPKSLFGGKGVYKGESIARKAFSNVIESGDYLAQEISPPSMTEITDEFGNRVPAKCDFRFFVYDGNIHYATARTYIGQTTNFRNFGGGFASVDIEKVLK